MWYLYLDESGDLGFDFVNKKPSKFFTITIVAVQGQEMNHRLAKEVRLVLRRKLNPKNKRSRLVEELKGERTTLAIKQYFYQRVKTIPFGIYSITLDKLGVYEQLAREKSRVYNFITHQVLAHMPFEAANHTRITIMIDRSKGSKEIKEFNTYIVQQLQGRIALHTPFAMYHEDSKKIAGLQVADLFAWGIHRKYEYGDNAWYDMFREKIVMDEQYNEKPTPI